MSDDTSDDTTSDLPPMPPASVEPPEPNPGGPDALPTEQEAAVPADLPVELNPAVDEARNPALAEGEDTSTKATRDEDPDDADEEAPV